MGTKIKIESLRFDNDFFRVAWKTKIYTFRTMSDLKNIIVCEDWDNILVFNPVFSKIVRVNRIEVFQN